MASPQLMAQAVTHLCFEAHTMTAEALSPPNPAESLRERLIREGKIVPPKLQQAVGRGLRTVDKLIIVGNLGRDFEREIKSIIEKIIKAFSVNSKFLQDAYLSLADKKINSLFNNFIINKNYFFEIARQSFFYAFKVDKRNTP